MRTIEKLFLTGHWRLTAHYRGTKNIAMVLSGHNLITTVGKSLVGRMLIDEAGYDTGLTVQAIGTDDTAPVLADTTLGTETFRKTVTSKSRTDNVCTWTTFIPYSDCTIHIKEAGTFGHSTADPGTPDSGILFSHWLVDFDNSAGLYDVTIDYELAIG